MPHNNYLYQTRDIKFQIKEWLDMDKLLACDGYKDYYSIDDIDSFLEVNAKISRDVICPANKDSDEIGMKFVGGEEQAVITPDSFKTLYNTVMEAGLGPQWGDRQSEGRMPRLGMRRFLNSNPERPRPLSCCGPDPGCHHVLQFEVPKNSRRCTCPKCSR